MKTKLNYKALGLRINLGLGDAIYLIFVILCSIAILACACKAAWSVINEPSIRNGTIALVMVPAAVFYFWVLFRHILIIRVTRIKNRQP